MEWKQIESAPKDRTRIILSNYKDAPVCGWWNGYNWQCTWNNWRRDFDYFSHWMELPPAPKKKHECFENGIDVYYELGELKMNVRDYVKDVFLYGKQIKFCPICGEKA